MKVDISTVHGILEEKGVEIEKRKEIIRELEKAIKEEKEEKADSATPKNKYEFVIVCAKEQIDGPVSEAALHILQIPETEIANFEKLHPTIRAAAALHNRGKKAKKHPLKTLAEVFQFLKPKSFVDDVSRADIFRKKEVKLKTKEPVLVVGVPNDIFAE